MILDAKGRQIIRLIGFGERIDTREQANTDAWLGANSSSGSSMTTSPPVWFGWDERAVAKTDGAEDLGRKAR